MTLLSLCAWNALWIVGLTGGSGPLPEYPRPAERLPLGRVISVLPEGDLLVAAAGQGEQRLRLHGLRGIDGGALGRLVGGETVQWRPVEERGTWVFRVPDGLCINLELVRQGGAEISAGTFAGRALFERFEQHARQRRVGRWVDLTLPGRPETIVYVTRSGTRYHQAECPHARKTGRPQPLGEASARLRPCGRCRPPELEAGGLSTGGARAGDSSAGP